MRQRAEDGSDGFFELSSADMPEVEVDQCKAKNVGVGGEVTKYLAVEFGGKRQEW